jgi:3-oxoacyl-[acyl-carrier protein] reductase
MRIEDVRAVVTGAASGIGKEFALRLAEAGAFVAAGDIDAKGLEHLAAACEPLPGRVITRTLDVSQEPSVTEFVGEVNELLGGVNALVNNAGILRDGLLAKGEAGWVRRLPTLQWQQVIDVNLSGPYLMAREVAAGIIKRKLKEGVIVNISSISSAGNPGQSNYGAAKAGLDACTRTWALELAPYNIRVGGIAPGLIDTPLLRHISEEAKANLIAGIPLGRVGTTYEIWLALKFIVECDFFTGRVIGVDGGSTF